MIVKWGWHNWCSGRIGSSYWRDTVYVYADDGRIHEVAAVTFTEYGVSTVEGTRVVVSPWGEGPTGVFKSNLVGYEL